MTTTQVVDPLVLAAELAAGERLTVLDVRERPDWPIEAPGVETRCIPAADVLADPAAVAAGLSGPVVVVCGRGISAQGAAAALRDEGVDASVLEGGMRGWLGALTHARLDLGIPGLEVMQIRRPGRGCLSYLLAADGEALVVDPAPDADFYLRLAAELGATVRMVFDTHLHADHLSGARAIADRAGATLLLPAGSLARGVAFAERVTPVADGERIMLGQIVLRALALPGHTTDMTGLLVAGRALIAGDSLFADGIARPDLERGDPEGARAMARTLHATLRERVLTLGDDTLLLPCHTHPGAGGAVSARLGDVRAAVPELALADADAFADALLADMPPRPENYEAVIAVNSGRAPFDPELEAGGNSCSTRR